MTDYEYMRKLEDQIALLGQFNKENTALWAEVERLWAALGSIAKNTCSAQCEETVLVPLRGDKLGVLLARR